AHGDRPAGGDRDSDGRHEAEVGREGHAICQFQRGQSTPEPALSQRLEAVRAGARVKSGARGQERDRAKTERGLQSASLLELGKSYETNLHAHEAHGRPLIVARVSRPFVLKHNLTGETPVP